MWVPSQIHDAMVAHAAFCHPQEACGLLAADRSGSLRMAYCLSNVEGSATSFTVDPVEHFHAMRHAERNGWELAGAFHSHPASDPYPSATDIALALDPGWLYVIVGRGQVRGWRIRNRTVVEEPLELSPSDHP